jgi:hypothetical protein
MANYHHKPIKKFNLSGVIYDESAIGRLRQEYVRLIESEMRLSGYVPRLDIDIDFTIDYNEKKKYFEFEITVHGIHGSKAIYTQKNKLKESLREQV